MRTKTSDQRPPEDLFPRKETPEPKQAKKPAKASLMQLPEDLLQMQIIPRLQGNKDGSAMAFALTNKKAHSQTTQTVARQLLGDIRVALNADAFASGANAHNVRPHEPHPASKAYTALMKLENLFITRGILTPMEASHPHRSAESVESALETVAEAVFAVVEGKTAGHKPVPFDTVSAFLNIKAYMHQPIDAWLQKELGKIADDDSWRSWDTQGRHDIQKVAEDVQRGHLDALEAVCFSSEEIALPPIWLYGSSMKRLRIVFSEDAEIPKELGHLTGLQTIHVYGPMSEAKIDALINCCKSISALAIDDLSTHHLPVSLARLPNLTRLAVSGSNISQMAVLASMPNLRTFTASDCPNLSFPNEVLELAKLEVLGFNGCSFNSVPDGIARLSHLRILELNSYPLLDLPPSIKSLNHLELLNIEGSSVGVPMFAAEMPHLKAVLWGRGKEELMDNSPNQIGHLVKGEEGYFVSDAGDSLDELAHEINESYPQL